MQFVQFRPDLTFAVNLVLDIGNYEPLSKTLYKYRIFATIL